MEITQVELPGEIHTIIISYLDNFYDVDTYQSEITTKINWTELILLNFPLFYNIEELLKYKSKFIYYDFIMTRYNHIVITAPTFTETAEYLLSIDALELEMLSVDQLSKYDSIEIYLHLDQTVQTEIIEYYIGNDNIKVVKYLIDQKVIINSELINFVLSNYRVSRNMINLINTKELNENDILDILGQSIGTNKVAEYLIKFLPDVALSHDFKNRTVEVLTAYMINFDIFKLFWEKYSSQFDGSYIREIIRILERDNESIDIMYRDDNSLYHSRLQLIKFLYVKNYWNIY